MIFHIYYNRFVPPVTNMPNQCWDPACQSNYYATDPYTPCLNLQRMRNYVRLGLMRFTENMLFSVLYSHL